MSAGDPSFFAGTDSAPHTKNAKENACGCAGCYTAHAAMPMYARLFEQYKALDKLEQFASTAGALQIRILKYKTNPKLSLS